MSAPAKTFKYGANFRIIGKTDPQNLSYTGAWEQVEGTLEGLAAHHSKGHPWMPAILDGNRKRWQANANYAEVLGADIDGGWSMEEAIAHPFIQAHCGLGIESSSSSPEKHKFRLVFRLPKPIEDWQTLRICNRYLIEQLPVADPACKDANRFFFGGQGRSPFLLNEEAVLPDDFIEQAIAWNQAIEEKERQRAEENRKRWLEWRDENPDAGNEIAEALRLIPPYTPGEGRYSTLIAMIGGVLNDCGAEGESLLREWDGGRGDWGRGGFDRILRTVAGSQPSRKATIATLFYLAKKEGWKPSKKYRALTKLFGKSKAPKGKAIAPVIPIKGLRRKPHLHIGDREFKEVTEQIPRQGLVALFGSTGSAKGEATGIILKELDLPWLSPTTLRSLARDQAKDWGGVTGKFDRHKGQLLVDGHPIDPENFRGSVCVPSLLAPKRSPIKVLVLDELPTIQDFLLVSPLANKQGNRALLIAEMERRIKEAELVIVASADLTEESLAWVEGIRGEQAYLVQSDRKSLNYPCHMIQGTRTQAIADYFQRAEESAAENKITVCHCDSKATADAIAGELLAKGIQPLLITQDTSGGEIESKFLSSKGLDLPELWTMGIRAIVTSPSVKEGFSLKYNTHLIESVWGVFEGGSITPEAIAQTLDRLRSHTVPRFVWVAERGRAYSKLSRAETEAAFINDFRKASTDALKKARRELITEAELEAGCVDWESANTKLLASIETERNRSMRALRARVETILKERGKKILPYLPQSTVKEAKATGQRLKEIRSQQEVERAIAIESAPEITEEQARKLEKLKEREALPPDKLRQLERFYIKSFYRLDEVIADDALWDKDGDRRVAIRHLERVLHPGKAIAQTAESINQNASTPQDWHRAVLQQQVMEDSGAALLIRDIWAGDVVELTSERIAPIADWLRENWEDFSQAFNFSNIDNISDNQLVFYLLDWVGISRNCTRARVNGKATRKYSVNQSNLEKLKGILEKRKQSDPPPQANLLIEGGGSALPFPELPPDCGQDLADMWAIAESLESRRAVLTAYRAIKEAIAS